MLQMQPIRGAVTGVTANRTPTMALPGSAAAIARARAETGSSMVASRLRGGLGDGTPAIPDWAIWAAGGLAAGALVGFVVWKRRGRKG